MSKGRPKFSVRFEPGTLSQLRSIAEAENITVSELLRKIVYMYLRSK